MRFGSQGTIWCESCLVISFALFITIICWVWLAIRILKVVNTLRKVVIIKVIEAVLSVTKFVKVNFRFFNFILFAQKNLTSWTIFISIKVAHEIKALESSVKNTNSCQLLASFCEGWLRILKVLKELFTTSVHFVGMFFNQSLIVIISKDSGCRFILTRHQVATLNIIMSNYYHYFQ